jgi:hypothetical protein
LLTGETHHAEHFAFDPDFRPFLSANKWSAQFEFGGEPIPYRTPSFLRVPGLTGRLAAGLAALRIPEIIRV